MSQPLCVLIVDDDWWDFTPQIAWRIRRCGVIVDRLRSSSQTSRSCPIFRFDESIAPDGLVGRVRILLRERDYDWIIPCSDNAASLLRTAESPLRRRVFGGPAPEYEPLLVDKAAMLDAVQEFGLAVPRQGAVRSFSEVDVAVARLGLPVVVKGPGGSNGDQVSIAGSAEIAWRVASALLKKELAPTLQEFFVGEPVVVGGLFKNGLPLRLHMVRTVRRHPADVGNSIEVETIFDQEIQVAALRIFRNLSWTGLANVDMPRSSDGSYVFLEVNGRPWGSVLVSGQAKVDFFAPLVQLLHGLNPMPDLSYRVGVLSSIFPKHLLAEIQRGTAAELWRILIDFRTWSSAPLRSPALTFDLTRRTMRVWAGTTRKRLATSRRPPVEPITQL